jgi:hypothetical protein
MSNTRKDFNFNFINMSNQKNQAIKLLIKQIIGIKTNKKDNKAKFVTKATQSTTSVLYYACMLADHRGLVLVC